MSLVNDMLRDLDQRRRAAEGSVTPVTLTPVSEDPKSRHNRKLVILVGFLLALAIGLGYAWLQLGGTDSARTLDIRPAVVSNGSDEEESRELPEPAETQPRADARQGEPVAAETDPGLVFDTATPIAPAPAPVAQDEPPVTPEQNSAAAPSAESANAEEQATTQVALQESAPQESSRQESAPQEREPQESPPQETDSQDTGTPQLAEAPATENEPGTDNTPASPTRNTQSVRNVATMSAEMLDTLAVQEALGLIADNRVADAYAHLESHIIDNRYAHQSRETFAKLLLNEGELLAAYNLVESGLALAPNHAGFKKVKARLLIADGQVEQVAELLSSRAPSVSEDLEYHEILATAQLANRDYEGALISYTNLIQQNRHQGKWWYGFAVSQDSLGNASAAQQAYNRAIQQADLSPNLRRRSQERLAALSE